MERVLSALLFISLCCLVSGQFGFFQNQQDENGRQDNGFVQNVMQLPGRVRHRLHGLRRYRPQHRFNRPNTNNNLYDQYERPTNPYQNYQENNGRPNYPTDNIHINYDRYGRPIINYQYNQEYPDYGNQFNNGNPVRFPDNPPDYNNYDYEQPPKYQTPNPKDKSNFENKNNIPSGATMNFPKEEDEEFSSVPPKPITTITEFTPNVTTALNTELPTMNPVRTEFPPYHPLPDQEQPPLAPLNPIPEKNPGFPHFTTESTSHPKTEVPPFKPPVEEETSELAPLNPIPAINPDRYPLTPVSTTKTYTEFPPFKPKSPVEIPTVAPVTTTEPLQTLTPVPASASRANSNFGTAGLFKDTCETVDGEVGICISVFDCAPYVALLQESQSNPAVVQVLRKAHCGFEGNNPKVCCPRPGIPTGPPPTPPTEAPVTVATGKSVSEDLISSLPDPPICGISNASLSRVVGGINANLGDFPWMALLGYKDRRTQATRWLCGGSLVSARHVLTAAHCIHGRETDLYVVRLGELDLAREDDGAAPMDVLIKSKIKHENYNAKAFTDDIGILVLERTVVFTDMIRPICIPRAAELRARSYENYNPIIAGWGDTEFRGPAATHLQALQLPVVSNDFCKQAYSAYKAQVIDERVLCAGYKKGGKDACQGDSGGPLMQPIWNNVDYSTYFYQIGVVSYGKKCAEAGFPGVYSRVTSFVPWLEKTVTGTA